MSAPLPLPRHPAEPAEELPLLVVDDLEDNLRLVQRRLQRRGFTAVTASDGATALRILAEQPVALVLLDVMMPVMNGYQVLEDIGRRLGEAAPPVIMLTARDAPAEVARAMELGAADYVTKPFDFTILEARIRNQLRRARSGDALRARASQLQGHLSSLASRQNRDPLTGLDNLRAFEAAASRFLVRARTGGSTHVMAVFALEEMPAINDTYGAATGDALLKATASILQDELTDADELARLRGDEFGVIFAGIDAAAAQDLAQHLLSRLTSHSVALADESLSVSVSVGLAPITAAQQSVADLIRTAEHAARLARAEGSNQIRVHRDEDQALQEIRSHTRWVMKLKRALREDALALYAQPIVACSRRHQPPRRFEVLVRLIDEGQVVSPGRFLPAVEKHGLATALDEWVVNHALTFLSAMPPAERALLERLSINLSGFSLCSRRFRDFLCDRLREARLPDGLICFEITETAAVVNLERAVTFIRTLQEAGARFALDDFGAGVSSFGYLRSLPVNCLKIDGQFVRHITTSTLDRGIVTAIRQIAGVMHMETVAEFVEDAAAADLLAEIGVDFLQGYYLGQPQPLSLWLAPGRAGDRPGTAA